MIEKERSAGFAPNPFTHAEKGEITPFGVGDGELHFWLSGIDGSVLKPTTGIKAYKPYAISMPNSWEYAKEYNLNGTVVFSAADVTFDNLECETQEFGSHMLIGTMRPISSSNALSVLNREYWGVDPEYMPGSIFVDGLRDVRAFEAYVLNSDGTPLHSPLPIGYLMDDANGISNVLCTPSALKVYTDGSVLYIVSPDERTVDLYTAGGVYIRPLSLMSGTNTITYLPRGIYILNGVKIAL